jgi:hypothetical protein
MEWRYKALIGRVYSMSSHGIELITVTSQDVSDGPIALRWGNHAYEFRQSDGVIWQHSLGVAVLKNYRWKVKEIIGIMISTLDDSRITSIRSPSFFMTTFSASLTKCTVLLPQSHDCSCYVSRPILAAPPFRLQKNTELRPNEFAHSSDWWHQPRLGNLTLAWSRRICGISPALLNATLWIPVSVNFFWLKSNQFVMMHSDTRLSTGTVLNIFLMEKWKKMYRIYLMRNGQWFSHLFVIKETFIKENPYQNASEMKYCETFKLDLCLTVHHQCR